MGAGSAQDIIQPATGDNLGGDQRRGRPPGFNPGCRVCRVVQGGIRRGGVPTFRLPYLIWRRSLLNRICPYTPYTAS